MTQARMDGTTEEQLMWRVQALRDALQDIEDMTAEAMKDAVMNALVVDNHNREIMEQGETIKPDPCPVCGTDRKHGCGH